MKRLLFFFVLVGVLHAESFITKEEYASSLYQNPRGIGCNLCHGNHGEGKLIASYKEDGQRKNFVGKPIDKITFMEFYNKLHMKIRGMPRYYLTDSEIQNLYYYLHREEFRHAVKANRKMQ